MKRFYMIVLHTTNTSLYFSYSDPVPKAVLFDVHSVNEIRKILKPSGFLGRNPEDDRDHFGKKRILGDQSWHS